eukprot:g10581.t1
MEMFFYVKFGLGTIPHRTITLLETTRALAFHSLGWVNADTWIRQPDDFAFAYWEKGVKEPKLLQFGGSQKLPTRMMFQYFNMVPTKLSNEVFQLPSACLTKNPGIGMFEMKDLERMYLQ